MAELSIAGVIVITILTVLALTGIAGAVYYAFTNRTIFNRDSTGHIGIKYNTVRYPEVRSTFVALQRVVERLQALACDKVFTFDEFVKMKNQVITQLGEASVPPSCDEVRESAKAALAGYEGTDYEKLADALVDAWDAAAKNICKDGEVNLRRLDEFMTGMYKSVCR